MRPDAVKPVGIRKKMRDFLQPLYALFAGDEFSRNAHDNGHNSESRRSQRHQIFVSRQNFNGHACVGMRRLPVIAKARLLHHGQQVVTSLMARVPPLIVSESADSL